MKQLDFDITEFSQHIFWDVDTQKMNVEHDFSFIVKRILEYGLLSDWKLLRSHFSLEEITSVVKEFRELDCRSLSFISTIAKEPIENFRCYITKQSTPPHWKS